MGVDFLVIKGTVLLSYMAVDIEILCESYSILHRFRDFIM